MIVDLSMKRISIVIGSVAAIVAGSVTIIGATKAAEPWWIAHREFVRDHSKTVSLKMASDVKRVESRQISTQLQMAKTSRRDIQSKIEDKQLILQQNPVLPQTVRTAIDEQIRSLKEEYEDISSTISDLSREQQQTGRP